MTEHMPVIDTVPIKGQVQSVDPAEIRRTLLKKIVDTDAHPTNMPSVSSTTAPSKVWWPTMMRTGSKSPVGRSTAFEVRSEDLQLQKKIGAGLRCDVFEAELKCEKRRVAVKQLRSKYAEDNAESLVADLQTLANTLRHPNLVDLIGVNLVKEERTVNLVFEHMGGGTLEDYFDARSNSGAPSRIPLAQTLSWATQLFEGLSFLHEREAPIILRDLKPCTLMVSADLKTLKIGDFGVRKTVELGIMIFCKREEQDQAQVRIDLGRLAGASQKGFTGTERYMAPEIDLKSKRPDYTSAADVYSAGLITWLLLEGERPWERHHGHVASVLARKGRRPPLSEDNSRYPARMAAIVSSCWAQQPTQRPKARMVVGELRGMAAASSERRATPCMPSFLSPARTSSAGARLQGC